MYSKEFPNELEQSFCDKIYDEYGLFISLKNPAQQYMNDVESSYVKTGKCFVCNVDENECKVCIPTRRPYESKLVCLNCSYDLNMFAINSGVLEYARTLKGYTIENWKKYATPFPTIG